tara:strand:- start:344 stop:565 length:222 start_codon:yes stop_codon:yes gene_type:complete
MNKKQKKMITDEVEAYHDIVSDYKDIFMDINNILDYSVPEEREVLDGLQSITNGFEEEINESLKLIHKIKEVK